MIFDLISSEYGWDTDKILTMTMRELSWRVEAIRERQSSDFKLDAQLHGHKVESENEKHVERTEKLSDEGQAAIDAAFQERLKGN